MSVGGEKGAWSRTFVLPALFGGSGTALLALVSDLPGSPFGPHAGGLWPLAGTGAAPGWEGPTVPGWVMVADQGAGVGPGRLIPTLAILAGVGLLVLAWIIAWRRIRIDNGSLSMGKLWWVFAAWVVPLLLAAPLASQDVWHYGAEGKMVLDGFGGYRPTSLLGHSVWMRAVDTKWATRPSLYGPGAIDLSAFFVKISGGRTWVAVECWRLSGILGLVLCGWGAGRISSRRGGRADRAWLAAAANPAVIIILVGGIHNDALMLGLTVAGVALAVSGNRSWGIVLCALGVAVKPNALLAVGALAWWAWGSQWRQRAKGVIAAAIAVGGVLAVTGLGVGGGFGWLKSVTSYAWVPGPWSLGAQLFGALSGRPVQIIEIAGAVLAVALVIGTRTSGGWITALGWGFAALAVTTPTPEPWYLAWAVVLLAAGGLERRSEQIGVVVLSAMMIAGVFPLGVLLWFEGVVALAVLGSLSLRSHYRPSETSLQDRPVRGGNGQRLCDESDDRSDSLSRSSVLSVSQPPS